MEERKIEERRRRGRCEEGRGAYEGRGGRKGGIRKWREERRRGICEEGKEINRRI